jgi:hypothetical protein
MGIIEIIFTHVLWRWHFETKECLGKVYTKWSTLFAIVLLWISFSLRLTSKIKKIVNLKWVFDGILLWGENLLFHLVSHIHVLVLDSA